LGNQDGLRRGGREAREQGGRGSENTPPSIYGTVKYLIPPSTESIHKTYPFV